MSDAFTALAALVALGAPLAAGPVGVVDAQPVLALHGTEAAGASQSIPVVYRDGEPAGRLGVNRSTMRRDDLPDAFVRALIAVEDASFPVHMGIDPAGLGRAVVGAIGGRTDSGGGSSLTQQLAKNALVGDSATLDRKIAEAISAVMTESVATKGQILESYANAVYFGRRAEGGATAAQNWFGREWSELDVPQNAFLAGVLRAPSGLDPARNPERAKRRRDHVLARMAAVGFIDDAQLATYVNAPIGVIPPPAPPRATPSPSDPDYWALSDARRFLGVGAYLGMNPDEPFRLTIDARAQAIGQAALDEMLEQANRRIPEAPLGRIPRTALERSATDPAWLWLAADRVVARLPEGAVRVVLGPDGPIVEPGLEPSSTDATVPQDAPVPQDAGDTTGAIGDAAAAPELPRGAEIGDVFALFPDGSVRGRPRVQGALVAIDSESGEVLASVGGTASWASGFDRTRAQRQPGSSIKPFVWLAALDNGVYPEQWVLNGPISVTVGNEVWTPGNYDGGSGNYTTVFNALERSYNQVAARLAVHVGMPEVRRILVSASMYPPGETGLLYPSASIGAVETSPHRMAMGMRTLDWRYSDLSSTQNLQDLERMMRGVVIRGTAAGAFANGPEGVAGKTGTSQEHRDSWFIGRTGDLSFAVWIGRDDDNSLPVVNGRLATGGSLAAPVAARFIREARAAGLTSETIDTAPFPSEAIPWELQPQPEPEPEPYRGNGGWWSSRNQAPAPQAHSLDGESSWLPPWQLQ